jgi:hypothetical protein
MTNIEHDNEYFAEKEGALMRGEITPRDRLQNQIRLGTILFEKDHPEKIPSEVTTEYQNEIMTYWAEEGYSAAYRELENDPEFKFHPRLQGDILRITVKDVTSYKKDKKIPLSVDENI